MPFRASILPIFVVIFASIFCGAQTAACTNWKFFQPPSPWVGFGPVGNNRFGTVVGGAWQQPTGIPTIFGFVRYSDGTFKTYMAPHSSETQFNRRNTLGVTVGYYIDSSGTHGLVKYGSSIATVDYPGASSTSLSGINYWGTIVGNLDSGGFGPYGFKLKNGVFTRIQYPGAVLTSVSNINNNGVIAGTYSDGGGRHGYIRQNGVYRTLDNPKEDSSGGTTLTDINPYGAIVGFYYIRSIAYSFIYRNGVFKDITPPGANYTIVEGVNRYGDVVGTTNLNSGGFTMFTARCQ